MHLVLMIWVMLMTDVMTSVSVVRQAEETKVVIAGLSTKKKNEEIVAAKKVFQFNLPLKVYMYMYVSLCVRGFLCACSERKN